MVDAGSPSGPKRDSRSDSGSGPGSDSTSRRSGSSSSAFAVVTGGGRGIGRGIVLALARAGRPVAIHYRSNVESAEAVRAEAVRAGAPEARLFAADLADVSAAEELPGRVLEEAGPFDLWVNNAGVAPRERRDILEATVESWDEVLGANLRGPYFATRAAARIMIRLLEEGRIGGGSDLGSGFERGRGPGVAVDRDGGGAGAAIDPPPSPQIHFITSVSSVFASVNRGEYCVSKAGLSMAAQLFAARLASFGIMVYEIRPGVIATDMTAKVRDVYDKRFAEGLAPIARWGRPEDVGRLVAALAGGALPYATGNVLYVDGGLHLRRL